MKAKQQGLSKEAQDHQIFAVGCQLQLRIKVITEVDPTTIERHWARLIAQQYLQTT